MWFQGYFLWWFFLRTTQQAISQVSHFERASNTDIQSIDGSWSGSTSTPDTSSGDGETSIRKTSNGDTFDSGSLDENTPGKNNSNEDTFNEDTVEEATINEDATIMNEETINEDTRNDGAINAEDINESTISENNLDEADYGTDATEITPTVSLACEASCTVYPPKISAVSWVPEEQIVYTTNFTVGIITTLVFLCNNAIVATRTQTEYHWNAAPAGMYPLYLTTNGHDNAVAIAAFTNAATTSVVELVYPNSHIAYDTTFSWEGICPLSYHPDVPAMCMTAMPEPSAMTMGSYIPFPRSQYPEPIATKGNGSDISGRGYRPLWVPLNSPPEWFVEHLQSSFCEGSDVYCVFGCQWANSTSPTRSIFYEPRYSFDHKTLTIDLGASGMNNQTTSSGMWRNSTRFGALCIDYTEQFAGLCENPEVHSSPDECVVTIWEEAFPTITDNVTTISGDDRYGGFSRSRPFTPLSKEGFETAYELEDSANALGGSATPFQFATDDWILGANGGLVTTTESLATQAYRNADASEAAIIADFFKGRTDERIGSWSRPQHTQTPTRSAQGLEPIKSEAVSQYFKEPLGHLAQTVADIQPAGSMGIIPMSSTTIRAHGLAAVASAFNRIFPQSTPRDRIHSEGPMVTADRIVSKPATPSPDVKLTPLVAAKPAVNAAANVLPSPTGITLREFLYVQVSTTIDGFPTTVAGYILLMTSTVMAGQQLAIDGKTAMLTLPALLPTYLSMTIDGVSTSTLRYIVNGWSTATVGQTVTVDGHPTVLTVPYAVFTQLPIVINGMSSTSPAYIISGSSIASIGQKITLNGTPTALAAPNLVLTYIATTVNGVAESGLAYIVTGEMTATIGQTITVEGSTTVLAEPTSEPRVVEGGAHRKWGVSSSAALLGAGMFLIICL